MVMLLLTPFPCFFIPLRSFMIFSNSDFSSSAFWLCRAIFSLNLQGFDDIADVPKVAVAMAPTVTEMFDVGVGDDIELILNSWFVNILSLFTYLMGVLVLAVLALAVFRWLCGWDDSKNCEVRVDSKEDVFIQDWFNKFRFSGQNQL